MEKTYILGKNKSLEQIGGTFIEIPKLINEIEVHNWVVELFQNNNINKVVIEIEKEPILSFQIGYHIRLSIENLREKVLIPIFYISKLSLNSLLPQTEIYSQILATKGVVFSEFDLESNKLEIEHLIGLNESDYLTKFLKIIHIQPDETIGRHSLANIWGAYVMDKASNANALPDDSEFKKKLYFKYISAFNNIDKLKPSRYVLGKIKVGDVNKIKAEGKRILLIDDEASKGWETVLRKIFKTSSREDFVVINEKVKGFEELSETSKRIIETEKFDLFLIDLRLNGLDEDENLKPEAFSGMKVLKKIKSINEGNQVIVFTASNKVWNLKALLDAGADDYYMKESPEYNFSKTLSEQNFIEFKDNVIKCFQKGYLRKIYQEIQELIEVLNKMNHNVDFSETLKTQLNLSYSLLKEAKSQEQFAYAFVSLYMIIEIINIQFIEKTAEYEWKLRNTGTPLLDWKYDKNGKRYINSNSPVIGDKPPEWQKVAGLYFQEWKGEDSRIIQQLYFLITKRNAFVHNNKEVLNKTRKDKNGNDIKDRDGNLIYLNHDIYEAKGFIKLFEIIKKIIHFL